MTRVSLTDSAVSRNPDVLLITLDNLHERLAEIISLTLLIEGQDLSAYSSHTLAPFFALLTRLALEAQQNAQQLGEWMAPTLAP